MPARTATLVLLAAGAWAALALLLGAAQAVLLAAPPSATDTLHRVAQLALPSALVLVVPPLVLVPAFALLGGGWARGWRYGLAAGCALFAAAALLWAALGLLAAFDDTDPFENLPWVTPPYLERFVAEHPQLAVQTNAGSRDLVLTRRGEATGMALDGSLLAAGTRATLEPCSGHPDADTLGGLPPYPGASCRWRLRLQRGDAVREVFRIELPQGATPQTLQRHYTGWASAQQADTTFYGGPHRYDFKAALGSRRWELWFLARRSVATTLYVERGGGPPPGWPAP